MFSFFKKKPVEVAPQVVVPAPSTITVHTSALPAPEASPAESVEPSVTTPVSIALRADNTPAITPKASENKSTEAPPRKGWMDKLKNGLRKTGSSIATVFTGTQIDYALYEELEAALLMSDAGVPATEYLLKDLKRRVKDAKATDPALVKGLLAQSLADLLFPLQRSLHIGAQQPTVIMIAGVNGAGKTTSIGKLTRHLSSSGSSVLLAAADTFRAAAKEQLAVWADRNSSDDSTGEAVKVDIISNEGADPAAVAFDAVSAGRARGKDVVMIDTAGRLPTQLHLMEELAKIKRVITKADGTAPHEVLLVIDGNTGQNALAQVKAFDQSIGLTGLIVTKLDGTAKGGVLAAIALWAREQAEKNQKQAIAVYFIGVGEKLEDLETFDALEFAQALMG